LQHRSHQPAETGASIGSKIDAGVKRRVWSMMPKSAKRFSDNIMLNLLESITFYDFGSFSIQNHRDLLAPLIPSGKRTGGSCTCFKTACG
jgi:hypothetical protein